MDVLEILRAGGYLEGRAGRARRRAGAAGRAPGAPAACQALKRLIRCLTSIEQKPSRRLWIFAGAAALALHLGGVALAVAHLQTDDDDDDLGAPAIEIGLELASPAREATDLPPGPETDASAASPQVAEQKAEVKQTELPKDTPTEDRGTRSRGDRRTSRKSRKRTSRRSPRCRQRLRESVAAEATATPSTDAIPESAALGRARAGHGESARRVRATWQKELVAHFDKHKRYPADRAAKAAEIMVSFELDRRATCFRRAS